MIKRLLIISATVMTLGGCVSTPEPRINPAQSEHLWQARQGSLQAIDNWTLEGRIALYNEIEAWNADLRWKQSGEHFDIHLVGPFGQGRVHVWGNDEGVIMETSDRQYRDLTPERLFNRRLGWNIPVSGLKWWVRGLPAENLGQHQQEKLDAQGRLKHMDQGGWDIRFKRYATVQDLELPSKVFLENQEWKVRLVIQDWRIQP